MSHTPLLHFIQENVLVLSESTSSYIAARAMSERRVGSAVVYDEEGNVSGILTDRDIACQLVARNLPNNTPIAEVMTPAGLTVTEEDSLETVIHCMAAYGIRRIPVAKITSAKKKHCVGIVCLDDLIAAQVISPRDLANIVRSQVRRRTRPLSLDTEERKEQTLGRFFNTVKNYTGLSRDYSETVARVLLFALVRRLPYTAAAHFITQLPSLLHDDLYGQPAGPNAEITPEQLVDDVRGLLQCNSSQAVEIIASCWQGISAFLKVDPSKAAALRSLPHGWKSLLTNNEAQDPSSLPVVPLESLTTYHPYLF